MHFLFPRIKYVIKYVVAALLHYSGLLFVYGRVACRGKTGCLMYHRVLPDSTRAESASNPALIVSQEQFEKQMQFLKRWYTTIKATELINQKKAAPYRVLVTFDDGWKDNFTYAAPILTRHGIPALIFIATDYIGSACVFWQETLTATLIAIRARDPNHPLLQQVQRAAASGNSTFEFRSAVQTFVNRAKALPYSDLRELMQTYDMAEPDAVDPRLDSFLTWEDVRSMHQQGIEFGSHTCSHRIVIRLSDEELMNELQTSARKIEQELGDQVRYFAYPNGDHDDASRSAVERAGYDLGFSVTPGFVDIGREPMAVRRLMVHDGIAPNISMFHCHLLGLI